MISREVICKANDEEICAGLSIPDSARGIVVFAHGSGSSRFSPRNKYVASELNKRGLATLLIDLLTQEEEATDEKTGELRFDIRFLAKRLVKALDCVKRQDEVKDLPIGLFGSSTGAAAALLVATYLPAEVRAVVSRGGRPDMVMEHLKDVKAPTLFVVGSEDEPVLQWNKDAWDALGGEKNLQVVEGAGHLFEEPGCLEEVAGLAGTWFLEYLSESS